MKFEWDEDKNKSNIIKHRVSFEYATLVFEDPYYFEMYDFDRSNNEDSYIAIGKVDTILFVVFTERKESVRIISARIANAAERRLYNDSLLYY